MRIPPDPHPYPLPTRGRGRAASGLQQPPDNSFDRRADFSAAHRARKSTQGKSAEGLGERPQSGYVAKGPAGIDPELADALGYGDSDPTRPLTGEPPAGATSLPTFSSRSARSGTGRCRSR